MPISELILRGMSRAVSDINTPDGGTAELINAVVENNEIRPAPMAFDERMEFELPGKLLAIHSLDDGQEVFISEELGDDGWYLHFDRFIEDSRSLENVSVLSLPQGVRGQGYVTTMGNVVVYGCEQGTFYFLFKAGQYIALGNRPPFPKLAFGLDMSSRYQAKADTLRMEIDGAGMITAEGHRLLNTTAQAQVSRFLADSRKEGKFIFPFFVRYALRMSDGTHILHSAPILMNPSTYEVPFSVQMSTWSNESGSDYASIKMRLSGYNCALRYAGIGKSVPGMENWTDIITHIDIFVSAPLYSYKEITPDYKATGGKINYEILTQETSVGDYGVAALRVGLTAAKGLIQFYEDYPRELLMPSYSSEEQRQQVENTSQFYLIHSLPISEFIGEPQFAWSDVPMEDEVLETLVNRPILKDDFNSLVDKYGKSSEVYNQRLILADMTFHAYEGYPLSTMKPAVDTPLGIQNGIRAMTVLQKGGTRIVVTTEKENLSGLSFVKVSGRAYGFYYYPDPDAKEMYVPTITNAGEEVPAKLLLKPHASLNGAYCFLGYPNLSLTGGVGNSTWPEVTDSTYRRVSEVYQSQVGNPFHFPLDGITAIGNTPLIAIVASTIEVSTGQVGDFPMYAFTEDGVWALAIDKEGWISTPQLISNDVCLGRSTIVSLNRPIIFATKRGLMLLEGSKISSLSDSLLGPRMDISRIKEDIKTYREYYNTLVPAESKESFIDFLSGDFTNSLGLPASVIYDYSNHRVLIAHPRKSCAYVLTLSGFEFSKMTLIVSVSQTVSHYSGVYIQDEDNWVHKLRKDIDTDGEDTETRVIAVTRPVKFGEMTLKTIKRMLTRHNCAKGVQCVLYGSRDGIDYCGVTSLRGRPYRYYILALFGNMKQGERISGVSIDWERKFTNKLR